MHFGMVMNGPYGLFLGQFDAVPWRLQSCKKVDSSNAPVESPVSSSIIKTVTFSEFNLWRTGTPRNYSQCLSPTHLRNFFPLTLWVLPAQKHEKISVVPGSTASHLRWNSELVTIAFFLALALRSRLWVFDAGDITIINDLFFHGFFGPSSISIHKPPIVQWFFEIQKNPNEHQELSGFYSACHGFGIDHWNFFRYISCLT